MAAVGLAAFIGNMGLSSRLEQAARARLSTEAQHVAGVAAAVYEGAGGWTGDARTELTHLAALDGLPLSLLLPHTGECCRLARPPEDW